MKETINNAGEDPKLETLNKKPRRKKREIIRNFFFKDLPSFLKEHSKECFIILAVTTASGVAVCYFIGVNNTIHSPFGLRKRILDYTRNSFIGKRLSKTVKNRFKNLEKFICANTPIQDQIGSEKGVRSHKILAVPVFISGVHSTRHLITYLSEGDLFSSLLMSGCVAYEAISASVLARTGDVSGPASCMYIPIFSKLVVKKYRNIVKGDPVTFLELYGLPDLASIKQFYGLK